MPAENVYEYTGLDVARVSGSVPHWQLSFIKPDRELHHCIFPTMLFDSTAVQYGLNLDTHFDYLISTALYEPMQPEIQNDVRDPGFAAGYKTTILDGSMWAGRWFTAETMKDVREARNLRMKWMAANRHVWDLSKLRKSGAHTKLWKAARMDEPTTKQLKDSVLAARLEVRGREDGNPLKKKEVALEDPGRW